MSMPNKTLITSDGELANPYTRFDCTEYIRTDIHEAEIEAIKSQLALAKDLLEDWSGAVTIPRTNCSCHISAPCNDCYEWSELRETASETKKLLEAK